MDKIYVNKSNGERVSIVNEDVNFFELDNSVRIKKDVFYKNYDASAPEVDPSSFFKTQYSSADPLANLANQLKNIDTSKVSDTSQGTQVVFKEAPMVLADSSLPHGANLRQPQSQTESQIQLSPEERKKMLDEYRKTMPGAQIPAVQDRNWDEEDERFLNGDKPITKTLAPKPEPVNPLEMMFKMFKNNYSVKLDLKLEEKIPNPQFIGMVQENVEADAIEYYAKLISDKLLKEPNRLKEVIYNQLKQIINAELGIEEETQNKNDEPQENDKENDKENDN